MQIRTNKHQIPKKLYIRTCFEQVMRDYWWAWGIPPLFLIVGIFYAFWTMFTIAITLAILYPLFAYLVLMALSEVPENKAMFSRLSFDISPQNITMRINPREGMNVTWDKIKKVVIKEDYFMMHMERFQFLHIPIKIFKNKNDVGLFKLILRRKGFLDKKDEQK